jgi:hypothetical protein
MKLHIDTEKKTVMMEGEVPVSTVFNYLMSWFPEEWEQWKFLPFVETVKYKEVIVEKSVWRSPYWNPWNPVITYTTDGTVLNLQGSFTTSNGSNTLTVNPSFTNSTTATLNFNNIQ